MQSEARGTRRDEAKKALQTPFARRRLFCFISRFVSAAAAAVAAASQPWCEPLSHQPFDAVT